MSTAHTETDYRTDGRTGERATDSKRQEARSVSDLFRELRDESTALLREEAALAKVEMSEKTNTVSSMAGWPKKNRSTFF